MMIPALPCELFEATVRSSMPEGLVGGDGVAADANLIKPDADRQPSMAAVEAVAWQALGATRRSVHQDLLCTCAAGTSAMRQRSTRSPARQRHSPPR